MPATALRIADPPAHGDAPPPRDTDAELVDVLEHIATGLDRAVIALTAAGVIVAVAVTVILIVAP